MYRSLLYVPASSPKFIEKAHLRNADAIILDLEDAVAENQKENARSKLADSVNQVSQNGAAVFIRVNNDPKWLKEDVIASAKSKATGIYLPKVKDVKELESLEPLFTDIENKTGRDTVKIVALIEEPLGVLNAQAIAQHPRVFALTAGSEDLATSMGAVPSPEVLHLPKLLVHLAAKAHNRYSFGLLKSIVDYKNIDDMKKSIKEAKNFGFDGASCLHPSIVSLLNKGFIAEQKEIEFAKRLLIEVENQAKAGIGAFNFEGQFIDAPIIQRAKTLLKDLNKE